MQDLGQEIEDFQMFHWEIKNYRKQDKRISSPEFECGGHKWYVSIYQVAAVHLAHSDIST